MVSDGVVFCLSNNFFPSLLCFCFISLTCQVSQLLAFVSSSGLTPVFCAASDFNTSREQPVTEHEILLMDNTFLLKDSKISLFLFLA